MRRFTIFCCSIAAVLLSGLAVSGSPQTIVWWRLVKVVDERTLILRSDEGKTNTVTLACIGRTKQNKEAIAYIERRLRDHKLSFWPLETGQTWNARPVCVILDMDLPGRGGEAVYDFPLLNEELLAWERAPFEDVKVASDPYGLKARLARAKQEGDEREKERKGRRSELGGQK